MNTSTYLSLVSDWLRFYRNISHWPNFFHIFHIKESNLLPATNFQLLPTKIKSHVFCLSIVSCLSVLLYGKCSVFDFVRGDKINEACVYDKFLYFSLFLLNFFQLYLFINDLT